MVKFCRKVHAYLKEVDKLFISLRWTKETEPTMIKRKTDPAGKELVDIGYIILASTMRLLDV